LEVTSCSTVPIVNCEHDYPRADENDSREVSAGWLQIFGHDQPSHTIFHRGRWRLMYRGLPDNCRQYDQIFVTKPSHTSLEGARRFTLRTLSGCMRTYRRKIGEAVRGIIRWYPLVSWQNLACTIRSEQQFGVRVRQDTRHGGQEQSQVHWMARRRPIAKHESWWRSCSRRNWSVGRFYLLVIGSLV
jgi:hypothetical protein